MLKEIMFVILILLLPIILNILSRAKYVEKKHNFVLTIAFFISCILIYFFLPDVLNQKEKIFFYFASMLLLFSTTALLISFYHNLNKIDIIYDPEIKNLSKKSEKVVSEIKEFNSKNNEVETQLMKLKDLFKIVAEINENIEIEKIIKEIFSILKNNYGEKIKQFTLVKGRGKDVIELIEFPQHYDYIDELYAIIEKDKIVRFKENNWFVFPLKTEEYEYKIMIEYVSEEDDSSFLSDVNFFLTKTKVGIERAILFREVEDLSRQDGLTGLYVRRYFTKRVNDELLRAKRYKTIFSLMIIDIDFFKKVNDTYGHIAGDKVLKQLAECFRETVKDSGLISRWGGEEFLIFIPYLEKVVVQELAEKLRSLVEQKKFSIGEKDINITISIGISYYPSDGEESKELIDVADKRLYKAKETGRNKVVIE